MMEEGEMASERVSSRERRRVLEGVEVEEGRQRWLSLRVWREMAGERWW